MCSLENMKGVRVLLLFAVIVPLMLMMATPVGADQWEVDEEEWGPNPLPEEGRAYLYAWVKALYQTSPPCIYKYHQHSHGFSYVEDNPDYSLFLDSFHTSYVAWTLTELRYDGSYFFDVTAQLAELPDPSPPRCLL